MLGHKNRKGILSSKVFEYMGAGKLMFLYATDDKELTKIVRQTGAGFIARGREEVLVKLQEILNLYLKNGFVPFQPVEKEVMVFTRENQVRRLAEAMQVIHYKGLS